jgi:hypothetical protein
MPETLVPSSALQNKTTTKTKILFLMKLQYRPENRQGAEMLQEEVELLLLAHLGSVGPP